MKDEKIMAIKKLFEEAQRIIADECKHNKTEDLLCQYEIIQTRKCESLTKEPDILNNLAVQAASYSVVRKFFHVLYPEDIYKFEKHFSTKFFKIGVKPEYEYKDWANIVVSWGNELLSEDGRQQEKSLDAVALSLMRSEISRNQPRSRIVFSLSSALPKVKDHILGNSIHFLNRYHEISKNHPGKAFDEAVNFSKIS